MSEEKKGEVEVVAVENFSGEVRVEHVLAALDNITRMVGEVRRVVANMHPSTVIVIATPPPDRPGPPPPFGPGMC